MRISKLKYGVLLFLLLMQLVSLAQIRECGQDKIVQILREISSTYDNNYNELYHNWKEQRENVRIEAGSDSIYTIQVVVHIVHLQDDLEQNIPDEIIYSQIDALNRDFGVKNADTINLRPIFKSFRGYPKIKFELAKIDTAGNPTTGIVRVAGKAPSAKPIIANPLDSILFELSNAVGDWFKKGYVISILPGNIRDTTIGSPIWDHNKYLNIWVTDLNLTKALGDGLLGGFAFAPPGLKNWPFGMGYPTEGMDGVSIDYRFFGENNYFVQTRPHYADILNKGRTTVHEVSHYLGLRHIWGDYGNVFNMPCNPITHDLFFSDGIDDTPPCKAPFVKTVGEYRCDTTVNTCNIPYKGKDYPDLFENYMDYSGDNCYNMFTKDQANFMRFVLTKKRNGIISKREVEVMSSIKIQKTEQNQFEIYPNPAQHEITLHIITPLNKNTKVELISITGQKIQDFIIPPNDKDLKINIEKISPATYILKIYNSDWITTESFIKY